MSRETTEAAAHARASAADWAAHKRQCPTCSLAARRRRWPELCATGARLRDTFTHDAAGLAANRAADKLPGPGQQTLVG
jgi:hypothetical protein